MGKQYHLPFNIKGVGKNIKWGKGEGDGNFGKKIKKLGSGRIASCWEQYTPLIKIGQASTVAPCLWARSTVGMEYWNNIPSLTYNSFEKENFLTVDCSNCFSFFLFYFLYYPGSAVYTSLIILPWVQTNLWFSVWSILYMP